MIKKLAQTIIALALIATGLTFHPRPSAAAARNHSAAVPHSDECWTCASFGEGDPYTGEYCTPLNGDGDGYHDCDLTFHGTKGSCNHALIADCHIADLVDVEADGSIGQLHLATSIREVNLNGLTAAGLGRLSRIQKISGSVLRTCNGSIVAREFARDAATSLTESLHSIAI